MAYKNNRVILDGLKKMAYGNPQWPTGILSGIWESSMAYRIPQWPRENLPLNGLHESTVAKRKPQWPARDLNGPWSPLWPRAFLNGLEKSSLA